MDPGSPSRRSWANEVEEESAAEIAAPQLPPLVATAHAVHILASSSLNPDAEPFCASPGERLHFSDSDTSLSEDELTFTSPKGKAPAAAPRAHSRRRPPTSGFMADARRAQPQAPRLRSVVVHPPRLSLLADDDGFRAVESRRRWRRQVTPSRPRPVPDNLVGRCFNCLATDHVRAACTSAARCFTCFGEGHQARKCPLAAAGRWTGKRGRSPLRSQQPSRSSRRRRSPHARAPSAPRSSRSTSSGRGGRARTQDPTPRHASGQHAVESPAASDAGPDVHAAAPPVPSDAGPLPDRDTVSGTSAGANHLRSVAQDSVVARPTLLRPSREASYRYLSSLRRSGQPPASPRTRASAPLLQLVVIPRSAAVIAAEEELSLALVAVVVGTRPVVTTAMVRDHLTSTFGIGGDSFFVARHRPEDFIVRFSCREDLEMVLRTPTGPQQPFVLQWWRWSRLSMATPGAFRFRVLVAMKGIPSHARTVDTAQRILGNSSTNVTIADDEALAEPDDERELFVAAWAVHPDLIPDEVLMALPEPEEEHDAGPPLFLRPWEVIHSEVHSLRYLVRLRIVEYQDWHTPPTSDDDGNDGRGDDDSGDSNCNGYWPGLDDAGGNGGRPWTTRFGGAGDPRLGCGAGPAFRPRQHSVILVGNVACPVVSRSGQQACLRDSCSNRATMGPRGETSLDTEVDFGRACSDSSVNLTSLDPMLCEAEMMDVPARVTRKDGYLQDSGLDRRCDRGFVGSVILDDPLLLSGSWGAPQDVGPCHVVPPSPCPMTAHSPGSAWQHDGPSLPLEPTSPTRPGDDVALITNLHEPLDQVQVVDSFVAGIIRPLAQPLIPSTPKLRVTRPQRRQVDEDWIPRRSSRLAAKSKFRERKPDKQARKVMMKRLGYVTETAVPDEASFVEFQRMFSHPLSPSKQEALDALFPSMKHQSRRSSPRA